MKRLGGTNVTCGNDDGHGLHRMTLGDAGSSARALSRLLSRFATEARSVLSSLSQRKALVDAGAMAFALFLASIPLMGLAGAVVAHVLRGEPRALAMLSSLVDVAPDEVHELVDRYVARGTDQAIAPVFLLGSLWLAAGAFHDAMTVFESALSAVPRTWVQKRLIAVACVLSLLLLLAVLGSSVVVFLGGPLALLGSLVERGVPRFGACRRAGDRRRGDIALARGVLSRGRSPPQPDTGNLARRDRHRRDRLHRVVHVRELREDARAIRGVLRKPRGRRGVPGVAVAVLHRPAHRRGDGRRTRRRRGSGSRWCRVPGGRRGSGRASGG